MHERQIPSQPGPCTAPWTSQFELSLLPGGNPPVSHSLCVPRESRPDGLITLSSARAARLGGSRIARTGTRLESSEHSDPTAWNHMCLPVRGGTDKLTCRISAASLGSGGSHVTAYLEPSPRKNTGAKHSRRATSCCVVPASGLGVRTGMRGSLTNEGSFERSRLGQRPGHGPRKPHRLIA